MHAEALDFTHVCRGPHQIDYCGGPPSLTTMIRVHAEVEFISGVRAW